MTKRAYLIAALCVVAIVATALCSCEKGERFRVEGSIENAEDSMLYFENVSLEGPVAVDSVKLSADGAFAFKEARPEAPEFYRLRIAGQIINISVDSTETITVKARMPNMAREYEVGGSEECEKIRELTLRQIELQNRIIAMQTDRGIGFKALADSTNAMVEEYKDFVKRNYIFADPKAASSYFALFQAIGPYLIFNPRTSKDDLRVFAAVATSWDTFRPGSLRGENLHNIAIQGMKKERIVAGHQEFISSPEMAEEKGLIDLRLPDKSGAERTLSELEGKVVLLDFHMFALKDSPARILKLREIYNKYNARGFEIYQVALDSDEHFWKQQTASLPWVCVWDEGGTSSQSLMAYYVQTIPDFFLIDRSSTLVGRASQIDDLEKAIEAEL